MKLTGITQFRDVLDTVETKSVRAALAAYDAATTAQTAHREPPPTTRRDAAWQALRAEHLAAAVEGRPPTLTGASIADAEAAIIDADLRGEALAALVARRTNELAAALTADAAHVWHAVAVARAAALRADPAIEEPPAAIASLWPQLTVPALAWVPAVAYRGRLQRWDIPALIVSGVHPGQGVSLAAARRVWDSHLWEQLEQREGRGWRLDDDGSLRLLTPWPTHARGQQPILVDQPRPSTPYVHRPQHWVDRIDEGVLVWVGTGPNGERGATIDDIALHSVTLS